VAASRDPFPFLPRGPQLLRRVLLAELLGPPRSRQQVRRPPAPVTSAPDDAPAPKAG